VTDSTAPTTVYGEASLKLGDATVTATANIRRGLSVQNLLAARKAALVVGQVESNNAGAAEFGPWADDILTAVPVAIIMSAAALEAGVNESIKDILDQPDKYSLSGTQIADLTSEFDSQFGDPRTRAKKVAKIVGRPADLTQPEWRDIELLIWMRNRLVHFKPRWDHEAIPEEAMFLALLKRVGRPNRFFARPKPEMPHGAFTYGCTKWAVRAVTAFQVHFAAHVGVADRFAGSNFSLP
jgi:hypothetical protein